MNKAPGLDKVSVQCFKDTLEIIIDPVTDIINCLQLAEVIPLHKDGDPDHPSNNTSVSLLPSLSKIWDKVVLNQLFDYLLEHELLTKHQSGNRKWHSTETLNIAVTDALLEAIDKKQLSIIIFLDLSKAFDNVQHDTLLNRIKDLGITTEVLNWFKSYLTMSNRSQYVRSGAATSTCASLEHGARQGLVLSPFLFDIYSDSLPSVSKSCTLESFVDDSKTFLTFSVSSMNCSLEAMEEDLQRIFQWCGNHSLLINPEKIKMLIVGSRQMMQQIQTAPNINFISKNKQKSYTDNGVFLDSFLSYDKHIQALLSACISKLCQINRVKHLFDQKTLAMIIDTLVMSKINYCSSVWSNTSAGNIDKIQLVQNYTARIISGVKKFDHISPTISAFGWLPVKEHLLYRDTLLMFKCVSGQAPSELCDMFKQRNQVHDRDTRSNEDLYIPKFRTCTRQKL